MPSPSAARLRRLKASRPPPPPRRSFPASSAATAVCETADCRGPASDREDTARASLNTLFRSSRDAPCCRSASAEGGRGACGASRGAAGGSLHWVDKRHLRSFAQSFHHRHAFRFAHHLYFALLEA